MSWRVQKRGVVVIELKEVKRNENNVPVMAIHNKHTWDKIIWDAYVLRDILVSMYELVPLVSKLIEIQQNRNFSRKIVFELLDLSCLLNFLVNPVTPISA